jgi:hypothetical protein
MKKYIAILFVALIAFACAGKQEVKAPAEAVEVTAAEEVPVDTTVAVPVDTTVVAPVQ